MAGCGGDAGWMAMARVVCFIEREGGRPDPDGTRETDELDSKASGPRGRVSSRGRFVRR